MRDHLGEVAHVDQLGADRTVSEMLDLRPIAVLLTLGASQVDQYVTNGRYTDAAIAMLRQMRHSFHV